MSFVVAAKNEDGVRVFGTFRDRAKAEALADRVNEKIEALEDAEFAEWQERSRKEEFSGEMMPQGYGRAGVLIVHKPSIERAYAFALGELDA